MANGDATTRSGTWTRLLRGQFGLRTILVLILFAALFMWWWVQLPTGFITEADTRKIKVGQTRDEVENLLGQPLEERWVESPPQSHNIAYRVVKAKSEVRAFVVEFDYQTHTVIGMSRDGRNYGMFMLDF